MLFGRPITFKVYENPAASEWLNTVWRGSLMGSRALHMARVAGQCGTVALTFSYDEARRYPWQINVMDAFDDAIIEIPENDPWDATEMRVISSDEEQVRVTDYMADVVITYKPFRRTDLNSSIGFITGGFNGTAMAAYLASKDLIVEKQEVNPLGIVPGWYAKNREGMGQFGTGDLWTMFEHIDALNLNCDLAYKHNQTEVYPRTVYRDVDPSENDSIKPMAPGQDIVVESMDDKNGDVYTLPSNSSVREHLKSDIETMIRELYDATGSVLIRMDEITNKGAMSGAVIEQLYAPLLEITTEKRATYGTAGIAEFGRRMLVAASNMNQIAYNGEEIEILWPSMLQLAEDDLYNIAKRQKLLLDSGLTTKKRAIEALAKSEGVLDLQSLTSEILSGAEEQPGSSEKPE
jgi:hypothetical protein